MNVVLCSMFRNAVAYIDRYFEQVEGLGELLACDGDALSLILGYGDSPDGTGEILRRYADGARVRTQLVECSHGGPDYGSVVDAQRFRQLAFVANRLVERIPDDADAVLWVESDLIWLPSTLATLIDRLGQYPAVAPMVMHLDGRFYDRWAFIANGVNFTNEPPYHPDLNGRDDLQMDSAGSCVAIRGEIARELRFPEEDVIVGYCRRLYELGASIWLIPSRSVRHP